MIQIANQKVGIDYPPFIIAEMSGNHDHSLDRAIELVDVAAKAGAHALKLQTYTADTMTIELSEREFMVSDDDNLWSGESLYSLYKKAHTPWEWHKPIFERAREQGMIAFSSPFDEAAIDLLESLGVPCYKIASFEITDIALIEAVARTGKPMIISTGMAELNEIYEALEAARSAGCDNLVVLKCTSNYPASPLESNVTTVKHMRDLFGCEVGLSDHTLGIGAAIASVSMGATVIEKHFTLSRTDGAVDSEFSLEPLELKSLVEESQRAWQSLGKVSYQPAEKERKSRKYRRSLYVVKDLVAGDVLTQDNVRSIRPGLGLMPKYLHAVIGKRVNRDVPRGTALEWSLFGTD